MKKYFFLMFLIFFNLSYSQNNFYNIYISADRTGAKESGISIEQGIRTALSEINYEINGYELKLVILDHRGSTPRSDRHLQQYLNDKNALVLFSGLHSPPLLSARNYINENNILILDPWAAAGPITRYPSKDNWIFRLSIDDTKAGAVITEFAIKEGFKSPYLILENTGWGKSNNNTMTSALKKFGITPAGSEVFNWGIGSNQAKVILRRAKSSGADVIFFVGNAPEGKVFMKALSELDTDERISVRSHWGITGGDFTKIINKDVRDRIDLKFIQTSFSFMSNSLSEFAIDVFKKSRTNFPNEIKTYADIKAPTGFIHSYDLTKILIQAIKISKLTGNIEEDRKQVRDSLEKINIPVKGLIKTYFRPFSVFSENNPDAHEALSKEDFIMAEYGDNDEILLINIEDD